MTEMNRGQGGTTADPPAVPAPKCKNCGSAETAEGPGSGPHHARLLCGECGGFLKWLPKPAGPENTADTDEGTDWLSLGLEARD